MQYQVLARKWRPQSFHELVGQEHVSRTLVNALQSGRIAHAFLFSGPRGSGKTTTARILAKALNCRDGKPGEPCGKCVACVEIAAGNCMDVMEIDAASNTSVENVRNVIEQVQYSPARDRNKIFIVDEVHMLSNAAFNALLKTLEEPPEHVVFIMATTEYHKIPATILSRCQQYGFKLIPIPLILERLGKIASAEKIKISSEALEQIAFGSGGSMRDAMSALDQVIAFSGDTVRDEDVAMLLGLIEPAVLSQISRAIAAGNGATLVETVAVLVQNGQDLHNFCRRLLTHFRNLMVLKTGVSDTDVLGVPASLLADVRAQTELFSKEDLLRVFDALVKVETDLKYATQVRFRLEMGLIEIAHLPRLRSLEELIADFRRFTQGEVPPPKAGPGPATSAGGSRERTPEPKKPVADSSPSGRDLAAKIGTQTGKDSVASVLQSASAEIKGDDVILTLGPVNDFLRRQVKDNLPALGRAASTVVGRQLRVVLDGEQAGTVQAANPSGPVPAADPPAVEDVLDTAKREPVVRSFLDVFPGPVTAERVDP